MNPITIINTPHNSLCSVNIILPIGSAHDPDNQIGITHLIEHLLFHAHPSLNQDEMIEKIEEMGGIFNAITEREMTIIYGRINKIYVSEVIQLFVEAIQNLPQCIEHIEGEQRLVLKELSTTGFKAYRKLINKHHQILFKNHPFQNNQFLKNDLKTITRKDILSFLEHYDWSNWKLLIIGNVNVSDIKIKVKESTKPSLILPPLEELIETVIYESTGDVSGITVSIKLPEYLKDLESIIILNAVLKGISSPFYSKVIKEKGIAYNIESSVNRYHNYRYLEFGWTCHSNDLELSIELLNALLSELASNESIAERYYKSGLERTKTEILLIQENFLRFSSHLTKQIALNTFNQELYNNEFLSSFNFKKTVSDLFSQPMLIGIHKKI